MWIRKNNNVNQYMGVLMYQANHGYRRGEAVAHPVVVAYVNERGGVEAGGSRLTSAEVSAHSY